MTIILKYCMALLLVVVLVRVEPCFGGIPFEPWEVKVVNNMTSGGTLFLHCKSKDDDLGQHNLRVGKYFTWRFRINISSSTLFWCYMRNKHGRHVSLDVFNAKDDDLLYYKCWEGRVCIWSVRDGGIYVRNDWNDDKFDFVAKWEV